MSEEQPYTPEEHEDKPKAKLGDFVTANLLVEKTVTKDYPKGINEARQGVFIEDKGDGTIVLQGETGRPMICKGPQDVRVVPDESLDPAILKFAQKERKKLKLS